MSLLGAAELQAKLSEVYPHFRGKDAFVVEHAAPMLARVRMPVHDRHVRVGGTISGPAMFGLADTALYTAILASIGWVPMTVTTNLSINFLSKPHPVDLIADCRLLKLGKKLAVGEVYMRSVDSEMVVAHATGTYSIPAH